MSGKLWLIFLIGCGAAFSQAPAQRDEVKQENPAVPSALEWLNTLDKRGKDPRRLLALSASELATAVTYLEQGQKTLASAQMVRTVAINYKRMHRALDTALRDRAAAALVKATEIDDPNLSLQNLNSLAGVDHPLVKRMMERLSSSRDGLISQQAKKHLKALNDSSQEGSAPAKSGEVGDELEKPPGAPPGEPSGKDATEKMPEKMLGTL